MIHPKILASIESCVTYDQIKTCINFVKLVKIEYKIELIGIIRMKAYQLRNVDLAHHISELEQINKK